jgi:hypothetical protein
VAAAKIKEEQAFVANWGEEVTDATSLKHPDRCHDRIPRGSPG